MQTKPSRARPRTRQHIKTNDAVIPLVSYHFDDSWSSIPAEAELIDRWFGIAIAELFGVSPHE
jgi:hypothetical protein